MKMNKIKPMISYTLQCLVIALIALEVAIPPNPYKTQLIIILMLYIIDKYGMVSSLINTLMKWSGNKH